MSLIKRESRYIFMWLAMLATVSANAVDVFLTPPPGNPGSGSEFEIGVDVAAGTDIIGSYVLDVAYDPTVLVINSIEGGDTAEFSAAPITDSASFSSGLTMFVGAQSSSVSPSGTISLAKIRFQAIGINGSISPISLQVLEFNGGIIQPLATQVFSTSVRLSFVSGNDTDNDGLSDQGESDFGTDTNNPDTDGDQLLDGFEVSGSLDPLDDGTTDFNNGASGDPDADGLSNLIEQSLGTNPSVADTDGDGLTDGEEQVLGTLATVADTDGDGLNDGYENANGLNPLDDGSTNVINGASGDLDGDGVSNIDELNAGTSPMLIDSDSDGLSDGYELANNLDPLDDGSFDQTQGASGDPDGDGFGNLSEQTTGSDPQDNHSQPVELVLDFTKGEQLVVRPLDMPVGFSTFDLLSELNDSADVATRLQVVGTGGVVSTAIWSGGAPQGDDIVMSAGQGALVRFSTSGSVVYSGVSACPTASFGAGTNYLGLVCVPPGEKAFNLLNRFGLGIASYVQRLNTQTGLYDTAYISPEGVAGVNFEINRGESYQIYLFVSVSDFDPLP